MLVAKIAIELSIYITYIDLSLSISLLKNQILSIISIPILTHTNPVRIIYYALAPLAQCTIILTILISESYLLAAPYLGILSINKISPFLL